MDVDRRSDVTRRDESGELDRIVGAARAARARSVVLTLRRWFVLARSRSVVHVERDES
jgi:hypothetical protein